ncbi:MAG: hypothetical protein EOM22_12470 [Gammaproteobacteria bacterium]|nr:hypothetical protein [Gammaproteobacteria bacterium]
MTRTDGSTAWHNAQIDADLSRELAYREHLRMAQDGVIGWKDLPDRLRDAYRRIQAELYRHQEETTR